ncbi:MAG: hypothetical protein AAFX56_06970 [Pseudomonadota bacterium]
MKSKTLIPGLLLTGALLAAGTAQAGGVLATCSDGVPFRWGAAGDGVGITFNPDQGDLGNLTNAEATALVAESFQAWEDIATSTATYMEGAALPVDVDITNFGEFADPTGPDGLSAIVYDDTGEIFEVLFGPDSGILGFAGPEFGDTTTCQITEGVAFLNGPAFEDLVEAKDIMVHEFGHFSNLAHVQVNGAIVIGDDNGPGFDAFPAPDFLSDIIVTMYPFYFGPLAGTQTIELDDRSSLSTLYPTPEFTSDFATISGSVRIPDGVTRISGVNVIARNVADPYDDASGILSGADTDETNPAVSDFVGTFQFTGLTPGAEYAVYVDEIVDGGFSTDPIALAPSPEEFFSGAAESNSDDPALLATVSAAAGSVTDGVDIILNLPQPGAPLPVGEFGDGSTELFTPFPIDFCGERYNSLFVNGNGNVTFGAPSGQFTESAGALLAGPPRIAGLWRDLNASQGGVVTFDTDGSSFFEVIWDGVPEFDAGNSNTFSIKLRAKNSGTESAETGNRFVVEYGDIDASLGLAGWSCGAAVTNDLEEEVDLGKRKGAIRGMSAAYEQFTGINAETETVDLANSRLRYAGVRAPEDRFEYSVVRVFDDTTDFIVNTDNDSVETARRIRAPFANGNKFAEIDNENGDVDFFRFRARANENIAVEVVRGELDTVIGLFDADTGELLAFDDDGGSGLLSRIVLNVPETTNVAVGVSTFPDVDFVGGGLTGGGYVLSVRKFGGEPVFLGDEDNVEIPLPRPFEFLGVEYSTVFLNSNGTLTFEEPTATEDGTDFLVSVPAFLDGPPRIAPYWADLDPTGTFGFGTPGFYFVELTDKTLFVHGVSLSEFFTSNPNYFSVEFCKDGTLDYRYGITSRDDALVGVTEGRGVEDPGPMDLWSGYDIKTDTTVYENFPNGFGAATKTTPFSDFDLLFKHLRFELYVY